MRLARPDRRHARRDLSRPQRRTARPWRPDHARGAERIGAALWFSDLRGYTRITDTAAPEQIIPLLNEYATEFHELGAAHLDQQHKHRAAKGLVRRLDALGYDVLLRPKLAA